MCKIESQREFAVWCREPKATGGMGREGERHVYACGSFMLMYSRNHRNVVKQLSSN